MDQPVPSSPVLSSLARPLGAPVKPRIGEILVQRGFITGEDLTKALGFQKQFGGRLGSALVRLGAVSEDDLLASLADQLALPLLDKRDIPEDAAAFQAIATEAGIAPDWWIDRGVLAWRIAPESSGIESERQEFRAVARDVMDLSAREILETALPGPIVWCLARARDLDRALDSLRTLVNAAQADADDIAHLRELAEEGPVVELVSNVFAQAVQEHASDIHVEPKEGEFDIRFRIDGVLQNRLTLPRARFDAVASRIKLIAGIDIAERRLPQDGRISLRTGGQEMDVRVSSLPGVWGESLVLRLLSKKREQFSLDRLGLAGDMQARYGEEIQSPYGIILVTGPTGSGKSTTLYATLEQINDGQRKIVTVEDPVEYNIPGITQVQTKSEIEYTFARALRAILRQDPDTIMIGEIRDPETAQIAVQASLTGHLVFSTLHTNDSLSAFNRLLDMGVEPFLVTSSVRVVMAQRLVRKLCPHCKTPHEPPAALLAMADDLKQRFPAVFPSKTKWYQANGCPRCQGTGYAGRVAIYEMAVMGTALSDAILARAPSHELARIARAGGFRSLREDGLLKAAAGVTSVEEVMRVTGVTAGSDSERLQDGGENP
jgi:general secretion pathway protein E